VAVLSLVSVLTCYRESSNLDSEEPETLTRLLFGHLDRERAGPSGRFTENSEDITDTPEQSIRNTCVRCSLIVHQDHAHSLVQFSVVIGNFDSLSNHVSKIDSLAEIIRDRLGVHKRCKHALTGVEIFTLESGINTHVTSAHARQLRTERGNMSVQFLRFVTHWWQFLSMETRQHRADLAVRALPQAVLSGPGCRTGRRAGPRRS